MSGLLFGHFIELDLPSALQVVLLGFIGGILSGFIGSGGAFFMTPGMMNLGVPGVVAVGSNITHKFGKAMMGSKKHGEYGNVDKRLAAFLVATSFVGIRLAVWINSVLFKGSGDGHGTGGSAAADLYISLVFICILSLVALSMLRDALRSGEEEEVGPSMKIANFLSTLHIPPYINFTVADVRVSLWLLLGVGLATGYLAGTIGVGGFIGVPAMIYVFGVPTAVAAGSELYLAMFMGGWGALNYAYQGFVDIRLTMLLYLGSLLGIFIGAYGVMVVRSEKMAGGEEQAKEPAGGKLHVMILDDEPIVGKRLRPVLEKSGFEVEVFENPTEALSRLTEKQFDIVVTDLRMEGLDGIHVLEHVMEKCKNTRVILITGYATVEVAREALVKGAFDFIAKPFKPRDLTAVVNKAALSLGHKPVS